MLEKLVYLCKDNYLEPLIQTVPYSISEGCEAKFVQITKTKGVKFFWTKIEASRSFNRQKKAALHKFGPKVFSEDVERFGFTDKNAIHIQWGYITEIAKTFNSLKELKDYKSKNINHMDILRAGLRKMRIGGYDLHFNNIGIIRRRLVCIDFGDESIR